MPPPDDHSSPFDDILAHEEQLESTPRDSYPRVLRFGVILAAVSFAIALLGSVIGNNVMGDPVLEGWATAANRYGMGLLLLSCVVIFAALRGPKVIALSERFSSSRIERSEWLVLLGFSFVAWVVMELVLVILFLIGVPSYWLILLTPTLAGLAITLAVQRRGLTRAYAIGFGSSLLCISTVMLNGAIFWMVPFNQNVYRGSSLQGSMFGAIAITTVVTVSMVNGLFCAGFASVLNRRDGQRPH